MVAGYEKPSPVEDTQNDEPVSRVQAAIKRCAYCVPPERVDQRQRDECLIKMLGPKERRQVSLALYRSGRTEGLFNRDCPMSQDRAFNDCPFYEDENDIPER